MRRSARTIARPASKLRTRLWLKPLEDRMVPATFIVNSTADSGAGTLRQAILDAQINGQDDTITFDTAGLFGSAQTITLTTGNMAISEAKNLTITGSGVAKLTISGAAAAGATNRIFNINVASATPSISISDMTLANGNVTGGNGGAILNDNEILTLTNVNFTGNKVVGTGGAIGNTTAGALLTLTNCNFTNNSASSTGGALNFASSATVTVSNSSFVTNTASGSGGAIRAVSTITLNLNDTTLQSNRGTTGGAISAAAVATSTVTLDRCLVTGNSGSGLGGGIYMSTAGNLDIRNSTLSSNTGAGGGAIRISTANLSISNSTLSGNTSTGTSATTGGGAILIASTPAATIRNTTIAFNAVPNATAKGGGIFVNSTTGTITLDSTIVAGNTNTTNKDFSASAARSVAGTNNLFGALDTALYTLATPGPNIKGTEGAPQTSGLDTLLANNGGTTPTHALLSGSLAIDAGSNVDGLSFDQRGTGFVRVAGVAADVGAYEAPSAIPAATVSFPNKAILNDTSYTFTVVYTDQQSNINLTTVDDGDEVTVTGPNGYSKNATYVSDSGVGKSVTVTYTIPAPDNSLAGKFDSSDNGVYTVTMNPGQVFDTDGVPNSVGGGKLGTFNVAFPANYVVTTNADSGTGSLRSALAFANLDPNQDTISFDPTFFSSAKTIALLSALDTITQPVIINGPGASKLTLQGKTGVRGFTIDMATAGAAVTISGLKITGGDVGGSTVSVINDGGAIFNNDAALTLDGVVLSGNTAGAEGGAINLETASATLTLLNSVIADNISGSSTSTTGADGGGINIEGSTTVTISNSVLRNNTAVGSSGDGGAIMQAGGGVLTIENSTVSGNTASNSGTAFGGGGIYANGVTTVTVTNSTFSGNSATASGGAIHLDDGTGVLRINNSTFFNNSTGNNGGGINARASGASVTIFSSIIAGNVAGVAGQDVSSISGTTLNAQASNIGNTAGIAGTFNKIGANLLDVDPLLNPLGNNGGQVLPDGSVIETHLPTDDSLARDAGADSLSLTTDQRGVGFPRLLGAGVDIGSVESLTAKPSAKANVTDITVSGGTSYVFTVVYSDEQSNINLATVDDGDEITVTGPNGYSKNATYVSDSGIGKSVTVTYTIPVPANGTVGQFDFTDNGTYTVALNANQVFDTDSPTPNKAPGGVIGAFDVAIAGNYVVTTDADSGNGSLRDAIIRANQFAVADTISFDPTFFSTAKTISLLTALDTITRPVVITGPGASKATVQATGEFRVLTIDMAVLGQPVSISGLTLTGGNATTTTTTDGGGINNIDAALTLTNMVITNNHAGGEGGGINLDTVDATLNMSNCVVSDNFSGSSTSATGADGGGINVESTGTVIVSNSVIRGNQALGTSGNGGGFRFSAAGTVTIINSTISGNTANVTADTYGGGGIEINNTIAGPTLFSIIQSTISGNSAASDGGGIFVDDVGVDLRVYNSTIAGNTASSDGGGVAVPVAATILFESTVIADNVGVVGADFSGSAKANNSLIETVGGGSVTGTGFITGVDPFLGALTNNGGFVLPDGTTIQTIAPQAGSVLRGAGSNIQSLTTDQRGSGFTRLLGVIDIGSLETDSGVPSAIGKLTNVLTSGGKEYTFTVTYVDEQSNINLATVDDGDEVTVTGPNGYSKSGIYVSDTGPGKSVTVTYKVAAPDNAVAGTFDISDNGAYTVTMNPGQVFDTDAVPNSVEGSSLGVFLVGIPTTFTVLNDDDSGAGSLRQAVIDSNSSSGADSIVFDPTFFSSAKTIFLLSELDITDGVVINGPGVANVTVSGGAAVRVFNTANAPATAPIFISKLTIANGKSTTGGGVNIGDESVTLTDLVVTGNQATSNGGGVSVLSSNATLTVRRTTFEANFSSEGGAITINASAGFLAEDCLFVGNVTVGGNSGGAIRYTSAIGPGGFVIRNSTLVNNSAGFHGGAVGFSALTGTAVFQNVTMTGNVADSDGSGTGTGGAIGVNAGAAGIISLESCIVSGNTSLAGSNPNFFLPGTVQAVNSLVGDTTGAAIFAGDAFTTANIGVDPMLDVLANNGGPTQTVALKAGSPALNNGSNPAGLSFDQRGAGFARISGTGVDIGAYELQVPATPAKVTSVSVNGGGIQRSNVTSLVVTFDNAPTFVGAPAAAFTLERFVAGVGTGNTVTLAASVLGNTVTLTFSGALTQAVTNSLIDGVYQLRIDDAQISNLDGDANGTIGGDYASPTTSAGGGIFRLFGDADGSALVDSADFLAFRLAFLSSSPTFDFDGSGQVDTNDFLRFRLNFLKSV